MVFFFNGPQTNIPLMLISQMYLHVVFCCGCDGTYCTSISNDDFAVEFIVMCRQRSFGLKCLMAKFALNFCFNFTVDSFQTFKYSEHVICFFTVEK